MAEGGGFNFNQWAQMNLGQQGGGDDVKPNEDEIAQVVISGTNKIAGTIAKLVPFLGQFLPTNAGQVSLVGSIETQGLTGKPISLIKGAQGGLLAKIGGELVKNSAITDHTGGVGGGGNADAGGSGGGGSQTSDSYASNSGIADMVIAAGGGNNFVVSNIDMAELGSLRPSFTPNMGPSQGAGIGV